MFQIMYCIILVLNTFHDYGDRQSPGDSVGTTWYDMQSNHSYGQRLFVDEYHNVHVNWMKMDSAMSYRYCAWNFRYAGGGYYGETQASLSWSGWVQLDVMRDGSARTVIAYHHDAGGGYYSWIDIDSANGTGKWPNDPRPVAIDHIWPKFTICRNNNVLLATGDYANHNLHHLYITTDLGLHWDSVATFDSCRNLTFFVRASRISGSNKVVFVHTQFIDSSVPGVQLDHNVWYMLSSDNGASWTSRINVTNYQPYPIDSVRAYADVNANFDSGDNLHIVWTGCRMDTGGFYQASKIFHWDEVHDTITVVSSPSIYYNEPGGWWIAIPGGGDPGCWRRPADRPELVMDTVSGYIYCIWHGNDDYTDTSAAGYFNGEFYGSYSTDNGINWSNYVNLTNTRTPGAGPGYCDDEDYATMHPYVINDSIWMTYIEDKDAGNIADAEGTRTSNPVRCWVFPASLITGFAEFEEEKPGAMSLQVAPNPFHKELKIQYALSSRHYAEGVNGSSKRDSKVRIYDATGRLVKSITQLPNYPITWSGDDMYGAPLPAGIYFIALESGDQAATMKVIKLK